MDENPYQSPQSDPTPENPAEQGPSRLAPLIRPMGFLAFAVSVQLVSDWSGITPVIGKWLRSHFHFGPWPIVVLMTLAVLGWWNGYRKQCPKT